MMINWKDGVASYMSNQICQNIQKLVYFPFISHNQVPTDDIKYFDCYFQEIGVKSYRNSLEF